MDVRARGRFRLYRHAAYRINIPAITGRRIRHHRERLLFPERNQTWRGRLQDCFRIGFELFETGGGAEVVGDAFIVVLSGRSRRIDGHATNWIDRHERMVNRPY